MLDYIKQAKEDGVIANLFSKLLLTGKDTFDKVKPVVTKLVADIQANPKQATTLIKQAISDLSALLPSKSNKQFRFNIRLENFIFN